MIHKEKLQSIFKQKKQVIYEESVSQANLIFSTTPNILNYQSCLEFIAADATAFENEYTIKFSQLSLISDIKLTLTTFTR